MKLSTSSNDFISFSFSSPIQQYKDPINGVTCDYRQGGPEESEECVVIDRKSTRLNSSHLL